MMSHKSRNRTELSEDERERVEAFFEPYNRVRYKRGGFPPSKINIFHYNCQEIFALTGITFDWRFQPLVKKPEEEGEGEGQNEKEEEEGGGPKKEEDE